MFWKAKQGRDLFRPYELHAIDALRGALSSDAAELLDRQVAGKELVQRLYDDAEVNTYPNRRGKQRHDPAMAFANRNPDLRLATVQLHGPGGKGRVVFHAVSGHLFQLRFSPKPAALGPRDEHHCRAHDIARRSDGRDAGATTRDYLERLDPAVRADLKDAWSRPDRSIGLVARDHLHSIDLEDGTYLVLAQLDDTSHLVARLDPPERRPGFGLRRRADREYDHLSDAMA